MAALHQPFVFYRGDTWQIVGTLHYADGGPFNLGAGAVVTWEMQDQTGAVVIEKLLSDGGIAITDPADMPPNQCLITVTAAQSAVIAIGKYRDQLRATDPSGVVSTQAVGEVEVRGSFFTP